MADASPFVDDTTARVLGLKRRSDRAFADDIARAVEKIDRALLPAPAPHPLLDLIGRGDDGIAALVALAERGSAREQRDAVDALAHVLATDEGPRPTPARDEACHRLRKVLAGGVDVDLAVLIEKTLAIAGDELTLREQLRRLGDDDPGVVATAARLVGLGRYRPALVPLKALVSPARIYESRWVIWALGELGLPDAIPTLEIALAHAFRVVDCLVALGKIGQVTSVAQVTPLLFSGIAEQRDAAARALAMILDKNRDVAQREPALVTRLVEPIERELADVKAPLSGSTRFFLLLCLARLGHKLDEARVRRYLGLGLDDGDVRHVASVLRRARENR